MKKVLVNTEFTGLSSGYASYGRELLNGLHKTGKYELAESACYLSSNPQFCNPEIIAKVKNIPWKVYPNGPETQDESNQYRANPILNFGGHKFEQICLNFKPDCVLVFTDYWMQSFLDDSPYRPYYNLISLAPCDGKPQAESWINFYSRANAVLTYQDWSGQVLMEQSGGHINWVGSAPSPVSPIYKPLPNKKQLKSSLGLGEDIKVVGFVSRNQRRKLFPDLFAAFRLFLDKTQRNDVVLYLHTSYPDSACWNIPELLKQYSLASKVYFTYLCRNCGNVKPSLFMDAATICNKCGQFAMSMSNVQNGVSLEVMSQVYNIFDFYVQYANCEGEGLGTKEAAACGVPVSGTDYSAMADIVRKLNGYPVRVRSMYKELETGCMRAVPDNEHLAEILTQFFNMPEPLRILKGVETRQLFEQKFDFEKSIAIWEKAIDSTSNGRWHLPKRLHKPVELTSQVNQMSNAQYARWLIYNVLGENERAGTYFESRLIRDLNHGCRSADTLGGLYNNDDSYIFQQRQYEPFGRQEAYNRMVGMCNRRNFWENQRV